MELLLFLSPQQHLALRLLAEIGIILLKALF